MTVLYWLPTETEHGRTEARLTAAAADYTGLPPEDGRLAAARENGRPFFRGYPGLYCSVTHSGGVWLCALSGTPVGVDLQQSENRDILKIAARFFRPEETEWLRQTPCWEGIGREAGVNQSQTACEIIIGQVRIILAQLEAAQHTLIYDVRIRQRTNIEIRIADTFLNTFTDKIEGALKDRHLIICNTCDKHLFDSWFVTQSSLTQTIRVSRHIAEMHQLQSLAFNFQLHNLTL